MATMRHVLFSRVALRLALAAGAAATISGCSEANRFASDPFSDPFGGSTKVARAERPVDNVSTGSIPGSSPAPVQSQQLAAPNAVALEHWTAQGGTPVTLAEGESPETVANRYGVPADVLVRVNGFSNASEVTPGSRLVIPVYRANKPAAAPHQVAEAPKPAPAPAAPAPAKVAAAAKPAVAQAKPAIAQAKPAVAAAKSQPAAPAKPQAVAQKPAPTPAPAQAARAAKAAPATVAAAAPPPVAAPAPAAPPPAAAAPKAQVAQAQQKDDEPSEKVGSGAHPEFRWPARGRVIQNFASGGNDGINIALPEGTQVKAAEAGVVAYAGNGLKGYGNLVLIKHPNGFVSAYAHNGELSVKAGDQVTRGQTIAKSGQSGDVPTPQLHFELRKGKTPVDPMGYLASL
jgi:murein DD-endopeptidase MepM/ murein hydrolase activator NlpD